MGRAARRDEVEGKGSQRRLARLMGDNDGAPIFHRINTTINQCSEVVEAARQRQHDEDDRFHDGKVGIRTCEGSVTARIEYPDIRKSACIFDFT